MIQRAPTHTRICLDLSSSERIGAHAKLPCDGVGLMRAEYLARSLGIHPRKLIADREEEKFLDLFSQHIVRLARAFAPRQMVYRLLDMSSHEYASLAGGAEYEKPEYEKEDQGLGFRGCSRSLAEEASFRMELRAVKRARDMGCVNVDLLLPFVRVPDELARCREIVIEEGLFASAEFELWMTAELPSTILGIEEFLPHVSGVLIDCDVLMQQLTSPGSNDSSSARKLDSIQPTVLDAIARVARACRERGLASSICGEAISRDLGMIRASIENGLSGLSIPPESFEAMVAAVTAAEAELGILPEREMAT